MEENREKDLEGVKPLEPKELELSDDANMMSFEDSESSEEDE